MNFYEWCQIKSNDPDINMFPKGTSREEFEKVIIDYLLPKDFYMLSPSISDADQFRTEQISYILMNCESDKFKNYPFWKQIYLKIHCFFTKTPIYYYY